jgi:4-amino-4-deoxy-L-arabinose transferase-like glycosyltransferase
VAVPYHPALDTEGETMNRIRHWLATGVGLVAVIAAFKLALHLYTAPRYGYFGDELYFMACGEHLDWGYVDHPPLIGLVAWVVRHTLGTSLLAIRVPSALAGVALVFLAALLARELGGGRFAMALAALSAALAPFFLVTHYIFTMNAFEPLFWTGLAWVVVRIVKTGDQRLWLAFGALAGVGLLNKYSMVVFAAGLVAGIVLSPDRRALGKPWIWAGGALALLILAPNLLWNVRHEWPFLQFVRNVKASGRDVELAPLAYVLQQGMLMMTTVPVALAGIGWLMLSRRGRPYRPLGWAYLFALAAFILTKGKDYYIAPSWVALFAAGAVAIEGFSATGVRRLARPAVVGFVLMMVPLLPLVLPLLAVDRLIAFQERLGFTPPASEKAHAKAVLSHVFAWQFGWDEMVAAVAQAYWALPEDERARVAIVGNNYGESGAIDLLGPRYGLPIKAVGTHVSYWLWGPGEPGKDVLIVLGDRADRLSKWCGDVEVVAELSHPYTAVWENKPVLVCRQPKYTVQEIWPKVKRW